MRKLLRWSVLLLLASCVMACSNTTPSTPKAAMTSTPTSQAIHSPLVGTYTTVITRKDIASVNLGGKVGVGADLEPGNWVLTFRQDGYYTDLGGYYPDGITFIGAGQYTVTQNQVTVQDAKCQEFYGNSGRTATYSWSLQGNILILHMVSDECPARLLVMTSHPWNRQS